MTKRDPTFIERLDRLVSRPTLLASSVVLLLLVALQLAPQRVIAQRATDLLQFVLAAAATVLSLRAAIREQGDARLFWTLIGSSTACWTAGQALFALELSAFTQGASWLQRGLFVGAAFPLAAAGMVRPDQPRSNSVRLALDVVLSSVLVLFLYFYVLAPFEPSARPDSSWRQAATVLLAVFVAATLGPLVRVTAGPWRRVYRQLAAAGVLWFAGNAIVAWFFFQARYRAGLLDIPWTIIAAASLALDEVDEPTDVPGRLDEIIRAGERAATMTHQLLAFGRRQALAPEVVDLHDVVSGTHGLLERLIGEDVRLVIAAQPHLPCVRVDRAQLAQILLSLAANAREAMPHGGCLTLALSSVAPDRRTPLPAAGPLPEREVLLAITDNGVGMTEEVRRHLFEPFFTTKQPDRGLGLAAVYGIVAQSGGRVAVDSTLGRGTTVNVFFPAVPAEELAGAGERGSRGDA